LRKGRRYIFLLLIVLSFNSCTLKTLRVGIPVEADESISLLTRLNSYNDMVITIKGKALSVYREGGKTVSLKTNIVTDEKESMFRVDLFDFVFRKPLISIIRKGGDVLAVIYTRKEYYTLSFEDFDFRKMIGFDLPKEILVSAIAGNVYIIEGESVVSDPDNLTLSIEGGAGRELIRFNREYLPVEVKYDYSTALYYIRFDKYKIVDNFYFPHKIIIKNEDRMFEINYTDIDVNIAVENEAFSFDDSVLNGFARIN